MTFITEVWRGQYSLAKQYWLFLALPSAVFKAADLAAPWSAVPDGIGIPYFFLAITVYIIGLVGLFRCVRNGNYQSRGWARAAIVVASLGAFFSCVQLANAFISGMQAAQ